MDRLKRKKESVQILQRRVAVTGFFAGLIWGSVWAVLAFFNFSTLTPRSFILETWLQASWIENWYGEWLAVVIFSLVSIPIAYIYYLCFRKLTGMVPGFIYGGVLWLLLILLSSSLFVHIPYLNELDINTIVTMVALFIIYGVFIGYTISYDFLDQPSTSK